LENYGIATVGAGADQMLAQTPRVLDCGEVEVRLVAFSDHPAAYAASPDRPGIAFADLRDGLPTWLEDGVRAGPPADLVLVMPHFLDFCYTRVASPAEMDWIARRLRELCAPFGTEVEPRDGMIELHADW